MPTPPRRPGRPPRTTARRAARPSPGSGPSGSTRPSTGARRSPGATAAAPGAIALANNPRFNPRRVIVLACIALVTLVFIVSPLMSFLEQRSEVAALERQVAAQERDVRRLERERELWRTDEYVEQQARERLGFVKVGEKSYVVVDPAAAQESAPPGRGGTAVDRRSPWYGRVWDSARAADDPNVVPTDG